MILPFISGIIQVLGGAVCAYVLQLVAFGGWHGNFDFSTIFLAVSYIVKYLKVPGVILCVIAMLVIPQIQYAKSDKEKYFTVGQEDEDVYKRQVDKIQKQDPDLILMDGDMLNEDGKNAQTAVELISALKKTAPVYYALGNHEIAYRQRRDKNLYQKLQKAGAKVVEKEYEDIKVRSNKDVYKRQRSRGMIYLVVAGIFYLIMNAIVSKVFSVIEKRMNYYR